MHISLVLLLLLLLWLWLRLLLSCKAVEAVHLLLLSVVTVLGRSLLSQTFLLLVLLGSCWSAPGWSFLHSLLAEEVVLQGLRLT